MPNGQEQVEPVPAPPKQGPGGPEELIGLVQKGIGTLAQIMAENGQEDIAEELKSVIDHFMSVMESAMGGEGVEKAPKGVPPEVGAAKVKPAF